MKLRWVQDEDHDSLLTIYAPEVLRTAASFESRPPDPDAWRDRVRATTDRFPWLVAEDEGAILGYAHAGPHRSLAAYRWCVEVSAYVGAQARRRGVARRLYTALLEVLRLQGLRKAYAGITLPNPASVALHESMGFEAIGVYPKIGYKLGAWHDVGWWHRRLVDDEVEPAEPRSMAEVIADPAVRDLLR